LAFSSVGARQTLTKESNKVDIGLFSSLKNLTATFIAIAHTRLDLLRTDLEEERLRLMSLLLIAFVSFFCLCVGVVFLAILIVVALWDTHRLLVLGAVAGVFLLAGAVFCGIAIRTLKAMPRMFAASLDELSKDQQQLDTRND
jgi:uncharacterized membrane protein YqjE